MRFSIIIPNYNNAEWLDKCLTSIMNQTYKNYDVIVIDDCSTDNSVEIIEKYPVILFQAQEKAFNGGARNMGISLATGDYILFLDSDDWFNSPDCLEIINKTIEENDYPDCVSLSYNCLIGSSKTYQPLIRNTIKDLVGSVYVACWTKCIKRELIQLFPENTLMEDRVWSYRQADNIDINKVVNCNKICYVWNRTNNNSVSTKKGGWWEASAYCHIGHQLQFLEELKHEEMRPLIEDRIRQCIQRVNRRCI